MLPGPDCPCGGALTLARRYDVPPVGETRSPATAYQRELWHCPLCGHYVNRHAVDMDAYYAGAYVDGTYGARMHDTFARIVTLPAEKSDNIGRVDRVLALAQAHFAESAPSATLPTVLDVGSGLCVFLHRVQQLTGWNCLALDPDARAVEHARSVAGVSAVQGNFITDDIPRVLKENAFPPCFSLITCNKVLEHVAQPLAMLQKARNLLTPSGIVYVELPDGECAAHETNGLDREEFHLEHWHVFSMTSACMLLKQAGFTVRHAGRLREPSGKYTLWLCAV